MKLEILFKELQKLRSTLSIYLASSMLNTAIPFLLIPVLTRYLSPSEYGVVGFFMIIVTGFSMISALGVEGAATRKYYDQNLTKTELADFIGSCMWIIIMTCLVLLTVAYVVNKNTDLFQTLDLIWILAAVFSGSCGMVMQLALGQAQVRERALLFALIQLAAGLSNLGISLALVVSLRLEAEGRILGILISFVLMSGISLLIMIRNGWIRMSFRADLIREALQFGIPLIPHSIALFVLAMADRYLISSFLDFEKLGIYVLAMQLAAVFSIFFNAFHNAFTPWLFSQLKNNDPFIKENIVIFTYSYYILFLLVGILASYIAPSVIVLVAGDEYVSASTIISWLIFSQIFTGYYLMLVGYILYEKKTRLLSAITVFSAALNIFLILVLIDEYGLKGVALASMVAMGVRFVLVWLASAKVHPMPWFGTST